MTLEEIRLKLARPEYQIPISRERYMDLFNFLVELYDMLCSDRRPSPEDERKIWKLIGKVEWRIKFNVTKIYKQRTL